MPEPEPRPDEQKNKNSKIGSSEETARILGEFAKDPRNGEDVTAEKYQTLLEKYERDSYDGRVRDIFKQYIIGCLVFVFVVDKIPGVASVVVLIAFIIYLQFLATHYKVDYVKDTASLWHN